MTRVIYFILFLLLALLSFRFLMLKSKVSDGEMAPNIEAELIDGRSFQLSELKGNYVLLDFWGSWCAPCRYENPKIAAVYRKFENAEFIDAAGFKVVTIALEKNDRTWRSAAQKDGFIWEHQIVEEARFVATSPLARQYGVTELPAKFLIGPDGVLMEKVTIEFIDEMLTSKLK